MSSPSKLSCNLLINLLNVVPEFTRPNDNLMNWCKPSCVTKAVYFFSSSATVICQYHFAIYIFDKYLSLLAFTKISSDLFISSASNTTTTFSFLLSIQNVFFHLVYGPVLQEKHIENQISPLYPTQAIFYLNFYCILHGVWCYLHLLLVSANISLPYIFNKYFSLLNFTKISSDQFIGSVSITISLICFL